MYLSFIKDSVCDFHFEISDLICRDEKTPTKMSIDYNPHNNEHFLFPQDYFTAVANWHKLRSFICKGDVSWTDTGNITGIIDRLWVATSW